MATPSKLRCLQLNVGKGRNAYQNLQLDLTFDIAFIQEPSTDSRGHPLDGWVDHEAFFNMVGTNRRKAVTILRKNRFQCQLLSQFSCDNVVTVEITSDSGKFVLINIYNEKEKDIEKLIARLEEIKTYNPKCILAGDFNARHTLWGDTETDNRGRRMEAYIYSSGLDLFNVWDCPPTFRVQHGNICRRSWIDSTMGRYCIVNNWRVCGDDTYSDHAMIAFDILTVLDPGAAPRRNLYRISWPAFREGLEEMAKDLEDFLDSDEANAEEAAAMFTEACSRAIECSAPLCGGRRNSKPQFRGRINY